MEHTSVHLLAGRLAVFPVIIIDSNALVCAGWVSYLWDTGVSHPLEEYCATIRDHGEPAKYFLPAVAVICLLDLICIEEAQRKLRTYRGEYV